MMRFLLVHCMARRLVLGKGGGARRARTSGMSSICPDHEADPTPAATVTLEDYMRAIGAALRAHGGRSVSAVTDCPNPEIIP
jgi:hypothetical protein